MYAESILDKVHVFLGVLNQHEHFLMLCKYINVQLPA